MIHPAEVDLGETAALIQQKVDELRPDRLVIDALTELRLSLRTRSAIGVRHLRLSNFSPGARRPFSP
jgi:hypothetical protein